MLYIGLRETNCHEIARLRAIFYYLFCESRSRTKAFTNARFVPLAVVKGAD